MYKLILYDKSSNLPIKEVTGFLSKQEARGYRQDVNIGYEQFWHIVESKDIARSPMNFTLGK